MNADSYTDLMNDARVAAGELLQSFARTNDANALTNGLEGLLSTSAVTLIDIEISAVADPTSTDVCEVEPVNHLTPTS
jgi:hypothetical protein